MIFSQLFLNEIIAFGCLSKTNELSFLWVVGVSISSVFCFCDLSVRFWNCSYSLVFIIFHYFFFNVNQLLIIQITATRLPSKYKTVNLIIVSVEHFVTVFSMHFIRSFTLKSPYSIGIYICNTIVWQYTKKNRNCCLPKL